MRAPPDGAVDVVRLTKRYGAVTGVSEVDLRVERGEVFGFLGANAAGKTTTIRCIVGLLHPTAGRVRVLGFDPVGQHREVASRIGYLPAELRLYPELSGGEHLRLLERLQGVPAVRRDELCQLLGLSARDLGRPVSGYSTGMKRKVGVVQAFQHDPELVVLDEPTEGLDPIVQDAFYSLVDRTRAAGRTLFLSSHVLSEVQRVCQRVGVIRNGRVVAVQDVAALRDAQARHLRLRFAPGTDPSRVEVDARWSPVWSGLELRLAVPADEVVKALRALLRRRVEDVLVEEADLDAAFRALYEIDR